MKQASHLSGAESTLRKERALLVGVDSSKQSDWWSLEDSLQELAQLARTAGAEVVGNLTQRQREPTGAFYLGKGKLNELTGLQVETGADVVIFDDELSPAQQRNLARALPVKVLDRTALILDIFAQRAHTHEGRLQVELAQHEYLLPRLAGQWRHLERLGGGIGTRGPGETQLESDRRLVRARIQSLREQLERVRRHRALYRRRRTREGLPTVALVGYTNAGKSTLFNALAQAGVLVDDTLFATLDPTARRLRLPSGQEVLLTDTVGFVQKLPPSVVAAFRATLEELTEAALLLHVIDITHSNVREQVHTVSQTLGTLGLHKTPILPVLNKLDRLVPGMEHVPSLSVHLARNGLPRGLYVSAQERWGLEALFCAVEEKLSKSLQEVTVRIPYQRSELVALFHQRGQVHKEVHQAQGTLVRGSLPLSLLPFFLPFSTHRN